MIGQLFYNPHEGMASTIIIDWDCKETMPYCLNWLWEFQQIYNFFAKDSSVLQN